MPKRSKSHQLETRSLVALRSRLPPAWVFREEHPDYGIDGSIEVFRPDGSPTGLRCLVQIKATGTASRRPSVRLRVETGNYYRMTGLPVLVVLYEADKDRLFARWFHEFDPFYGGLGKKTLTFAFKAENIWDAHTPETLERDLEVRRILASGAMPLPIPVEISSDGAAIEGMAASQALYSIRSYLRRCSAIFKEQDTDGALWIRADGEKLVVSFRGAHSATLHYSDAVHLGTKFGAEVLVLVALSIGMAGDHNIASTIANNVAGESSLLTQPEVFLRIMESLVASHQPGLVFEMAEKLLKDEGTRHAAEALFLLGLLPNDAKRTDAKAAEGYMRRKIAALDTETAGLELGTTIYNLANHLRGMGRFREALSLYRQAGQVHPPYCERDYYWREIASLLFGARFYRLSADLYAKAVAMGGPPFWRALYADASMHAGRFSESLDAFDWYLRTEKKPNSEWVLKRQIVQMLVAQFGERVQRSPRSAASVLKAKTDSSDDAWEALRLDPLSVEGWLHVAEAESQVNDADSALSFVTAAVLARNHAGLWIQALVSTLTHPELDHMIRFIAFTAFEAVRENIDQSIEEFLRMNNVPQEAADALYQLFNDLRLEYDATISSEAFEVRIAGEDAEYSSFFVGGDEPPDFSQVADDSSDL